MEVDRAHNVSNRVSGVPQEQRGVVSRVQDSVNTQLCPCVREVRKWDPQFFSFDVGVAFVRETVNSIFASQVPLVELAIVVVGDFVSHLEEGREQGVSVAASSRTIVISFAQPAMVAG